MTLFSKLAQSSGLNRFPILKHYVKGAFYRCQDPFNRGVPLHLGGKDIRVPSRFARPPWQNYEPPATRRVANWLSSRPDAAVIDVGCSIALYSLLTVALARRGDAWAIDSDLVSLQSSRWLCRFAGPDRLHVIRGYAGNAPTVQLSAAAAAAATAAEIASQNPSPEPSLARYICLDTQSENKIPVHRLDTLFADADPHRPWLLKIDVEGAELLVLQGAEGLAERLRPQLLISVHPPALRSLGLTPNDIRNWLVARRYHIEIDVESHEEHWWCTTAE